MKRTLVIAYCTIYTIAGVAYSLFWYQQLFTGLWQERTLPFTGHLEITSKLGLHGNINLADNFGLAHGYALCAIIAHLISLPYAIKFVTVHLKDMADELEEEFASQLVKGSVELFICSPLMVVALLLAAIMWPIGLYLLVSHFAEKWFSSPTARKPV
ncbi:hypothetical protein [Hymenobacter daeguensis]